MSVGTPGGCGCDCHVSGVDYGTLSIEYTLPEMTK